MALFAGLDQCSFITSGPVSTWMGDPLPAGKPSCYVASHLGQLSLPFPCDGMPTFWQVMLLLLCVVLQKYRPCPAFVVKEMESSYIEELKNTISLLMANLEGVPVAKGGGGDSKYSLSKFKRYSKYAVSSQLLSSCFD